MHAPGAPFCWPTPPYACYPGPVPQTDPLPCEIAGLNGGQTKGRLTFFVPDEAVAHVQVPPARTTLPLRFDQFRWLTLTTVLAPAQVNDADPHAQMLSHRAVHDYRITLASRALRGRSRQRPPVLNGRCAW